MFRNEFKLDKKLIIEYIVNVRCRWKLILSMFVILVYVIGGVIDNTLFYYYNNYLAILLILVLSTILTAKNTISLNEENVDKTVVEFGEKIIESKGKGQVEYEYKK